MKTKLCANCAAVYEATGRNSKYCNLPHSRVATAVQAVQQAEKRSAPAGQDERDKGGAGGIAVSGGDGGERAGAYLRPVGGASRCEGMSCVYNADCMEAMRAMPDKCFELAVVDPPYFDGPNKRGYYGNKQNRLGVPRVIYPKTATWEVPGKEYFDQLFRVSRNQIIWGVNYYDYHFGPGRIIWDKCNGDSSFSDCEIAYCSMHDSVRLFRFMWNGMMQGKSISEGHIMQGNKALNEKRFHPTQKPVALYAWLFNRYAKRGDKILDTHLGSGSSRIAAYDAGLDFTGYEIDKGYFEAQEERYRAHTAQLSLLVGDAP